MREENEQQGKTQGIEWQKYIAATRLVLNTFPFQGTKKRSGDNANEEVQSYVLGARVRSRRHPHFVRDLRSK